MNQLIRVDTDALKMFNQISSFSKTAEDAEQEIKNLDDMISKEQEKQKIITAQEIITLQTSLKRVQAFVAISKQIPTDVSFEEPVSSEPYNPDKLNRINVLLNTSSEDACLPSSLYYHARAQEMGLEEEINRIKSEKTSEEERVLLQKKKGIEKEKECSFSSLCDSTREYLETRKKKEETDDFKQWHIGTGRLPVRLEDEYDKILTEIFGYSISKEGFSVDLMLNLTQSVCCIENDAETHEGIVSFLKTLIIRSAQQYGDRLNSVLYIDPYLMNDSELVQLTAPIEERECIVRVPQSRYQISDLIKQFSQLLKHNKLNQGMDRFVCIICGFQEEYDSDCQDIIREICFNSELFKVTVVLVNNVDSDKSRGIHKQGFTAQYFDCEKGKIELLIADSLLVSDICFFRKTDFSEDDVLLLHHPEKKKNLDNRYDEHISPDTIKRQIKGTKKVSNLPYALSDQGEILKTTLSFGYLYGATGSGKSTMLHTLISSIVAAMHPDDVELWLVDFKMVEFNRYIRFCPPHVRQVILDSSPEMVFDLLDRLSTILKNRMIRFEEHHWSSVRDAHNDSIYMPLIIVIIDEFPVMSQIIDDSPDYKEKLISLLAKGRQFGFILLLSGQYFTTGLQGLPQAARDQMNWRAAMNGTVFEIKETLDLRNKTDHDNNLINRLKDYYVLVRHAPDFEGNEIDSGKVLFYGSGTEGEERQLAWIKKNTINLCPTTDYIQSNQNAFFDKHPEFYDGHRYVSFLSVTPDIHGDISMNKEHKNKNAEPSVFLYPGQPRCLRKRFPIEIRNNSRENILLCAHPSQNEELVSLVLSLIKSCSCNANCQATVLSSGKKAIAKRLNKLLLCQTNAFVYQTEVNIIREIKRIYDLIRDKTIGNEFIMYVDYSYIRDIITETDENNGYNSFENDFPGTVNISDYKNIFGPRPSSSDDVFDKMKKGAQLDPVQKVEPGDRTKDDMTDDQKEDSDEKRNYPSLNDMMETILHLGPRLGYHVALVFLTPQDCLERRKDAEYCTHKFFFKAAKDDVLILTKSQEARYIETMELFTYRYVGDIESMSYRPYMHEGVMLEGWQQIGTEIVRNQSRSGSYLE